MNLNKALETMKFDTRLVEYNKNNQTINDANLKQHLDQLEDLSEHSVSVTLESVESNEELV